MSNTKRRGARAQRQTMGEETVAVLERGHYQTATPSSIRIGKQIEACVAGTQLYLDDELELLLQAAQRHIESGGEQAQMEVTRETTLEASARLHGVEGSRVGALNFASARNPGGGFLRGSQAQEESLARSSALYMSQLECQQEYYNFNRRQSTLLYSDRMIYSPDCTVFRADDGAFLDSPYEIDIVTSPAPNKGAIKQNKRSEIAQIPAVFERRMKLMLSLFSHRGCTHLVLGAWGCGVFGNEPEDIAELYRKVLIDEGFGTLFEHIVHAIYEPREDGPCFKAFREVL